MKQIAKKTIKEIIFFMYDVFSLLLFFINHCKGQYFRNEIIYGERKTPLFILGNGPSFGKVKERITDRSNVNICAVNYSILTDEYFELKPEMHVFADPCVFDVNYPESIKLYEVLEKKLCWPLNIFVPYGIPQQAVSRLSKNENVKIVRYSRVNIDLRSYLFKRLELCFYKKGLAIPVAMNVIVACIFCGINSGYKNLYLYGVEHSWMKHVSVNMKNEVCLEDVHYYGSTKSVWTNSSGITFTMYSLYTNFAILYKSYEKLKSYVSYLKDVHVINRTPDSFIDTFPKEL